MVNLDDPDAAADELTRCRALGLCGALVTVAPPKWLPFSSPDYDRFWATAQDLDMPLSMHTATDRGDPRVGDAAFALDVKHVPPSVFINKDYQVRQALGDLIFTGVFERHPGLRVGAVEHELGWIPYFLDQMDYTYTDRPPRGEWHRFPSGVLPSDYWRSNCFASFQEDAVGIRVRDVIGVDTLMWGSDYPHTESTFPRSQEILCDILGDVAPGDAREDRVDQRREPLPLRSAAGAGRRPMTDLAVRGGTVVDGSGAPAFRADVGIADGRIVEIGDRVTAREEIDAAGRLVVPGFVDIHTHYDPQVLWDPELSPSLFHGVTSVVAGNCGYSIAPTRPADRASLCRTLDKVEDMRLATLEAGIEWDFETYAEYLDAVHRRGTAINFGGYVGHTPVRMYVMGDDAYEREATDDEITRMHAVVADSIEGRCTRVLERPRRLPSRRRRPSGAVDHREPGGDRGADACHRRDRPRHRAHRAGRELRMGLRVPTLARSHHHVVVDPHLPARVEVARAVQRQDRRCTARAAMQAPTCGCRSRADRSCRSS